MMTCHSVWSTVRHPLLIIAILACLSPAAALSATPATPAATPAGSRESVRERRCAPPSPPSLAHPLPPPPAEEGPSCGEPGPLGSESEPEKEAPRAGPL